MSKKLHDPPGLDAQSLEFGVPPSGIPLANSGEGRMGGGNVRQTSVCRWLPPIAHRRKPRQNEVCRTFSEFASSISGGPLSNPKARPEGGTPNPIRRKKQNEQIPTADSHCFTDRRDNRRRRSKIREH